MTFISIHPFLTEEKPSWEGLSLLSHTKAESWLTLLDLMGEFVHFKNIFPVHLGKYHFLKLNIFKIILFAISLLFYLQNL